MPETIRCKAERQSVVNLQSPCTRLNRCNKGSRSTATDGINRQKRSDSKKECGFLLSSRRPHRASALRNSLHCTRKPRTRRSYIEVGSLLRRGRHWYGGQQHAPVGSRLLVPASMNKNGGATVQRARRSLRLLFSNSETQNYY